MENQILLHFIQYLSKKAPDPDGVYADRQLAQGIRDYIREEKLVEVIQKAGVSKAGLPIYLDMRLARFRDMPYENIRYFFCHRALLAQINDLVAWFRENRDAPDDRLRRNRLRLRELCAQLGSDPTSRALAKEALFHAEFDS
ncbi:MAG: hypothetical protein IJO21_07525 [Oscillospiraceae bacterium]|nr:hypothetical protein [Oscillospiraceae bacterium]MBQ7130868.1 hypothetical protein [Oscillospiraceae bacterium]